MKRILIFAVIIWMGAIWSFSARPADESTETSHFAGRIVAGLVIHDFQSWPAERQMHLIERIDHPVRKAAHAAEYAVLGFLLFSLLRYYLQHSCFLAAWVIGTLYAVSDEIHQYFVPGRSCQLSDMILDSVGVLAGAAAGCFLLCLLKFFKKNEGKNTSI